MSRAESMRRLYFYAVAGVAYALGIWAFNGLLRTLVLALPWFWPEGTVLVSGDFLRDPVALYSGALLVTTPVFVVHWVLAQRRAQAQPEERVSALRKLYLYLVLALSLGFGLDGVYNLVVILIQALLQVPVAQWEAGRTVPWPYYLVVALAYLAAARAWQGYLVRDGDLGQEMGLAGTVRRLFQTGVGMAGLVMALGAAGAILGLVLRSGLERLATGTVAMPDWRVSLANEVAVLLIGVVLWRTNSRRWDQIIAQRPDEARAALRRLYLYAATVFSAALAVVPAAFLLRDVLLMLFGVEAVPDLVGLASPLGNILVGAMAWRWHWRVVQSEADRYGDSPESETVRRIYYYLVAATGLILLWLGLVDLVQVLLDATLVPDILDTGLRARQAANGISLAAVGLPVWGLHWRTVQRMARLPDERGLRERASVPRRAYLYGVALAGALLILFDLGRFLYQWLLLLLGGPGDPFGGATLNALVRSGVAFLFWLGHVMVLREDQRLGARWTPTGLSPEDVAAQREALAARIRELEAELARLRAELTRLDASD